MLELQDSVALDIASQVKGSLSPEEQGTLISHINRAGGLKKLICAAVTKLLNRPKTECEKARNTSNVRSGG